MIQAGAYALLAMLPLSQPLRGPGLLPRALGFNRGWLPLARRDPGMFDLGGTWSLARSGRLNPAALDQTGRNPRDVRTGDSRYPCAPEIEGNGETEQHQGLPARATQLAHYRLAGYLLSGRCATSLRHRASGAPQ